VHGIGIEAGDHLGGRCSSSVPAATAGSGKAAAAPHGLHLSPPPAARPAAFCFSLIQLVVAPFSVPCMSMDMEIKKERSIERRLKVDRNGSIANNKKPRAHE
jgi:hypothetical protein